MSEWMQCPDCTEQEDITTIHDTLFICNACDCQFNPRQEYACEWPHFDCPECGQDVWLPGFDDATTVDGQGEFREVRHCGVCEFVAIRRV